MVYREKIGVIALLFVLWMIIQAVRAELGPEPYPAIKYPGFPGNGKKPLYSRDLYVIKDGEAKLITYSQSVYGHPRFRRLLRELFEAASDNDQDKLERNLNGLIDIDILSPGDTVEIVERKWVANKTGYSEESRKSEQIIL